MSNYKNILTEISQAGAQLIAVSKMRSQDEIMNLYNEGQRIFAENRVQLLLEKQALLPADINWHLIGHLQSNKVKQILPVVSMIHSVDSLKLLWDIEKEAKKINKPIQVLLQIHIAQEETKFGLDKLELIELLDAYLKEDFTYTKIVGLMGMATNTDDEALIRTEFKQLKELLIFVKNGYFINRPEFKELSMGMSSDYKIALEEGSTIIRMGSLLFT